jgi:hypothetical protein
MKLSTLIVVLTLCAFSAQATTFTLNNNNPSPGQYTTFDAAQTAASSGDTVLVQASPNSYDGITFTKSLTLIGPGHRPAVNGGTTATFGNVFIGNNLSNVVISGIILNLLSGPGGGNLQNNDNLTISNCFFTGGVTMGSNSSNVIFSNNIFTNSNNPIDLTNNTGSDLTFSNNYFSDKTQGFIIRNAGGSGTKVFTNNVFASGSDIFVMSGDCNTAFFENNIFYRISPNGGNQTNCVNNNNLSYQTFNNTLPPSGKSGSNNLVNIDPQFVNFTLPGNPDFNYGYNYRLQNGSPGLGAGTFGTNLGLYESDNEFSMTGEPARPQTTAVIVNPAVIPSGGSTQVNFTIRKSTPNQ